MEYIEELFFHGRTVLQSKHNTDGSYKWYYTPFNITDIHIDSHSCRFRQRIRQKCIWSDNG